MAATDYKISSANVNAVHVEAQPTTLRGSATQNKQVFDKYSDMIVEHFNDLCDFIDSTSDSDIDNDVLVLYEALGWVQD